MKRSFFSGFNLSKVALGILWLNGHKCSVVSRLWLTGHKLFSRSIMFAICFWVQHFASGQHFASVEQHLLLGSNICFPQAKLCFPPAKFCLPDSNCCFPEAIVSWKQYLASRKRHSASRKQHWFPQAKCCFRKQNFVSWAQKIVPTKQNVLRRRAPCYSASSAVA